MEKAIIEQPPISYINDFYAYSIENLTNGTIEVSSSFNQELIRISGSNPVNYAP